MKKRKAKKGKSSAKKPAVKKAALKKPAAKKPAVTASSAVDFVTAAKLPAARASRGEGTAASVTQQAFDTAKEQATVVGSALVSFVPGVTAERRQAIVDCSLFAQLWAKNAVPDEQDIEAWYKAYFNALSRLGWVIEASNFSEYRETSQNFEAHKAIIAVATALMGAAPTALGLITTTLEALQSMDESSPWITIFNRESQNARVARFQVGLAEEKPDGKFVVSLMAFALKAEAEVVQVLFFKARTSDVSLKHYSGNVTVNDGVLDKVRGKLTQKLAAYADDFICTLPDPA